MHKAANPPFIPLCLDVTDKPCWRQATNDERVFALAIWLHAARGDNWGVVWGDPVKLCFEARLDPSTFSARLEWMIGAGLACYLTRAEAEAMRSCPLSRSEAMAAYPRGGEYKGGQDQDQDKQGKGSKQASQEPARTADSQASFPARARQTPESKRQGQASTASTATNPSAQAQATPQTQEPANLPKSDPGAVAGHTRVPVELTCRTQGCSERRRPPADRAPEAVRLGELLAWGNPRAVEFGRRMFAAIYGHEAPPDLPSAAEQDRGDVGVWVHYWQEEVETTLPAGVQEAFVDRCVHDITKKRKVRGIRNLGAVARGGARRQGIVPGILAAMRKRPDDGRKPL